MATLEELSLHTHISPSCEASAQDFIAEIALPCGLCSRTCSNARGHPTDAYGFL